MTRVDGDERVHGFKLFLSRVQVGQSQLIADVSVFARVLCRGQRVLCVDYFKYGRFSRGVAQASKTQTFVRRLQLCARDWSWSC